MGWLERIGRPCGRRLGRGGFRRLPTVAQVNLISPTDMHWLALGRAAACGRVGVGGKALKLRRSRHRDAPAAAHGCDRSARPSASTAGEGDCRAWTARGVLVSRDRATVPMVSPAVPAGPGPGHCHVPAQSGPFFLMSAAPRLPTSCHRHWPHPKQGRVSVT